jgi:hypothetical protein
VSPDLAGDLAAAFARAWEDCRTDLGLGVAAVLRRNPEADPIHTRGHLQWVLDHQVFPPGAAPFGTVEAGKAALSIEAGLHLAGAPSAAAASLDPRRLFAGLRA